MSPMSPHTRGVGLGGLRRSQPKLLGDSLWGGFFRWDQLGVPASNASFFGGKAALEAPVAGGGREGPRSVTTQVVVALVATRGSGALGGSEGAELSWV